MKVRNLAEESNAVTSVSDPFGDPVDNLKGPMPEVSHVPFDCYRSSVFIVRYMEQLYVCAQNSFDPDTAGDFFDGDKSVMRQIMHRNALRLAEHKDLVHCMVFCGEGTDGFGDDEVIVLLPLDSNERQLRWMLSVVDNLVYDFSITEEETEEGIGRRTTRRQYRLFRLSAPYDTIQSGEWHQHIGDIETCHMLETGMRLRLNTGTFQFSYVILDARYNKDGGLDLGLYRLKEEKQINVVGDITCPECGSPMDKPGATGTNFIRCLHCHNTIVVEKQIVEAFTVSYAEAISEVELSGMDLLTYIYP